MPCNQNHPRTLDENQLATRNNHQTLDQGRHKCCQCAYRCNRKTATTQDVG